MVQFSVKMIEKQMGLRKSYGGKLFYDILNQDWLMIDILYFATYSKTYATIVMNPTINYRL